MQPITFLRPASWVTFGAVFGSFVALSATGGTCGGTIPLWLFVCAVIAFPAALGLIVWTGLQWTIAAVWSRNVPPSGSAEPVKIRKPLRRPATDGQQSESHRPSVETLRDVDLLRGLRDEQLQAVGDLGRTQMFVSGEILGVQGSGAEALYIIVQGQAQLLTWSARGEFTVRVAGHGETLPLAALVGDGRLITTVLALSDLEAVVLPRAAFLNLCAEHSDLGMHVFQNVAEILGRRYRLTLERLVGTFDKGLQEAELWANM